MPEPLSRRFDVASLLDGYKPSEQELMSYRAMVVLAGSSEDVLSAYLYDPGHFTASAFVVDASGSRLLLVHHAKLDAWLQPGGHIEPGDSSMLDAAVREVGEETGVHDVAIIGAGLFDVDVHRIPAHKSVPPHLHHDLRFLLCAEDLSLEASTEVNEALWVPLDMVDDYTEDVSVRRAARKIAVVSG